MTRRTSAVRLGVVGAVLVVLFLVSLRLDRYSLDLGTTLLIYLCATQGWNILAGYAGEYSLASSAFIGTGAYASALLSLHLHWPPLMLLAAGAAFGALLSLVLSLPLLRVRGDYFTIASLTATLAVQAAVVNIPALGGATGLNLSIDTLPIGAQLFQFAAICAAAAAVASVLVRGSSFGLRLMALRDDADAAEGVGINVFRHRLGALVLSGGLIGTAGSLLALQQVTVEPTGSLGLSWTIDILLMGTVGGLGTLLGPLVGVVLVKYALVDSLSSRPTLSLVVEGVVLIVVVLVAPRGVWPTLADWARTAGRSRRSRPRQVTPTTDGPMHAPGRGTPARTPAG